MFGVISLTLKRRRKMTYSIVKRLALTATVSTVAFLSGCMPSGSVKPVQLTAQDSAWLSSKPAALQSAYENLLTGANNSRTLLNMEIASTAIRKGYYDSAKAALDKSLDNIETIYANNPEAKKARSLWYSEDNKDFKGESYERAMAYCYRGLLYLVDGDYDNARASFESGILQDAFAEEEQNSADFAVLMYLSIWASQKAGSTSLANERWRELSSIRPDITRPPVDHDTLVFVGTGKSPRKLRDGIDGEDLVYRRGKKFSSLAAQVDTGQGWNKMKPIEDLYYQAATRGGRPVDRINKGKAKFKSGAFDFGNSIMSIGSEVQVFSAGGGLRGSASDVAGGLVAIGAISSIIASRVKAKADNRYWHGLPDGLHIYTYSSKGLSNTDSVKIQFMGKGGLAVGAPVTSKVHRDRRGNGIVIAHSSL